MLIGHDELIKSFEKLLKENKLSHGYLFFGEPEVGKFSFAENLAAYLEIGEFQKSQRPLTETLVLKSGEEETIGIDNIREAKYFLNQKPTYSSRRIVIIDEAEKLTPQAQHAILKIAEEPPETCLIIIIASNPEVLLPTLQSRLQKIYFPRINSALITTLLVKQFKLNKEKAAKITEISFGRPGRAIKLAENGTQKIESRSRKALIEGLMDDEEAMSQYLTDLIAQLAKNPIKNYIELKAVLNRLTKMSQFNTNKRLQLESALWNI